MNQADDEAIRRLRDAWFASVRKQVADLDEAARADGGSVWVVVGIFTVDKTGVLTDVNVTATSEQVEGVKYMVDQLYDVVHNAPPGAITHLPF